MKKICAIVPLYNEEDYCKITICSLKQIIYINKIIVIDDGSKDNTLNIIEVIDGIEIVRHEKNMGKAESIRDGIKKCDADIYVFIDGDLGETAINMKPLIDDVLNNNCDMCIAKPITSKGGGIGILRLFAMIVVKIATNTSFPCPLCGQRAVKREIIMDKRIRLYNRYGIEVGMLIDALNNGYRVKYMDLDFTHRYSQNNIKGYFHRFKQFIDILIVFLKQHMRW